MIKEKKITINDQTTTNELEYMFFKMPLNIHQRMMVLKHRNASTKILRNASQCYEVYISLISENWNLSDKKNMIDDCSNDFIKKLFMTYGYSEKLQELVFELGRIDLMLLFMNKHFKVDMKFYKYIAQNYTNIQEVYEILKNHHLPEDVIDYLLGIEEIIENVDVCKMISNQYQKYNHSILIRSLKKHKCMSGIEIIASKNSISKSAGLELYDIYLESKNYKLLYQIIGNSSNYYNCELLKKIDYIEFSCDMLAYSMSYINYQNCNILLSKLSNAKSRHIDLVKHHYKLSMTRRNQIHNYLNENSLKIICDYYPDLHTLNLVAMSANSSATVLYRAYEKMEKEFLTGQTYPYDQDTVLNIMKRIKDHKNYKNLAGMLLEEISNA